MNPSIVSDPDCDEATGYKPPAERSLADILSKDQEDESLERYKRVRPLSFVCRRADD